MGVWAEFFKNPENWMKLISSGVGFAEAKDKSGNTINPKDAWAMGNPSGTTPFYNVQSDWNKGKPTSDRQFSPQLQQVFDEIIWGALGEGREPYGMNENMRRLQNLQENNQLGRYGQTGDPYSPKPEVGGRQGYDPIGRSAMDEIERAAVAGVGGNESSYGGGYGGGGGYVGGDSFGGGQDFDMMGDLGLGWMNPAEQGGTPFREGYGGYGSDGEPTGWWERLNDVDWANRGEDALKFLAPPVLSYLGLPMAGTVLDKFGMNDSDWMGRPEGQMHPDSRDFIPPNSSMSANPEGGRYGSASGMRFGTNNMGYGTGGWSGGMGGNYGANYGGGYGGTLGGSWGSGGSMGGGTGVGGGGGMSMKEWLRLNAH